MRFPFVLMLTALGCAAPALAEPAKSGDDAPAEPPPEEGEPGEGAPGADEEEPPAHDEPEAAPEEPREGDEPSDKPDEPPAEEDPPVEEKPAPPDPPAVKLSEPEFINGDVPAVTNILEKTLGDVAQCVADHGGLDAEEGGMKVQFLVRARGRAEGVEVLKRHGVTKDAARCVQKLLKNKWVGMPTEDPTGVQFRYDMKR